MRFASGRYGKSKISILNDASVSGLGFLSLGAAVALTTGLLVSKARQSIGAGYRAVALLPLLLSGGVMLTQSPFKDAKFLGLDPVGILLGLMWTQAAALLSEIENKSSYAQVVAYLYIGVVTTLSLAIGICTLSL